MKLRKRIVLSGVMSLALIAGITAQVDAGGEISKFLGVPDYTDCYPPNVTKAVKTGDIETIVMKLRSRAIDGETALHVATKFNMIEAVELLVTSSPNASNLVNSVNDHGNTLLHVAASNGFCDMASLLLSNGADINAENQSGQTPLFVARHYKASESGADNKHEDTINLLINWDSAKMPKSARKLAS